ncbi:MULTISPECIES: fimbria/pilus outer membrane usher protein [unclassified Acinetobacter]|uniref:fimbria/pilus outer membrane usher protein n=1 Tax=unclassified Acinetobacter TaxID=196816 RepID=UPI0029350AE5|nr:MULTISPECIES: fimbria/pilus outer membrane usher protein [unclassified Acinetobacter]WOE30772.1 fimbria/pilus outer membrane usher protein [Acinetobacter sp. SAAs470]WOE38965.1 fimbria/pilus outer membrane usher protein [Acinetobacter sp. SAAs474]
MTYSLRHSFTIVYLSFVYSAVYADTEQFNTDFLLDLTDQVAVDAVKRGYAIAPGLYKFSIIINHENLGSRTLRFYETPDHQIEPCIDQGFIDAYQILLNTPEQAQANAEGCYNLSLIERAVLDVNVAQQEIKLSLPQVNLVKVPRGYVSPQLFDEGINAVIVNYTANTNYYKKQGEQSYQNSTLFLNGGVNLGAWRYRNQSMLTKYAREKHQFQNIANKIERDLIRYQARLELGDSNTSSDVFDSYNFRGIQISSDTAQLPAGLQNYAPIIRGIAYTNAVVDVRQNGYLIYSTNVAPGNFVIDDLYAANESGDLEVTVNESDGRVEKFIQPFSSVPNMIRPGQHKYQLTSGQYRTGDHSNYHPYFGQLTYAYGLNNYITPYAGTVVAEDYYALATGMAWSFGTLGSFSVDATYARNTLVNDEKKDGVSLRFLYAKSLNQLGTNFRLVGYRYSTAGYYSLADAVQEKASWHNGQYAYTNTTSNTSANNSLTDINQQQTYYSATFYNKKNQSQIALSQDLGRWGQLYGNFTKTDYWQKDYNMQSWQLGYNNNYKRANYSLYYQQDKSFFSGSNYSVGIALSFLLDRPKLLKSHNVTSNSSYQHSNQAGSSIQTSLSGSFLQDQNLNLQMQVTNSKESNSSIALSSSYRGTKHNSNFGYTYSHRYQQVSAGISGGMLIHSGGVLLGQQMNSNPIIIEAKGAEGVRLENQPGLKIDQNGYAIISNSSAYLKNRVALRAEDLGQNVSVENSVINDIVPTKMAIVKVKFDVKNGHSVLANLQYRHKSVVTGAMVLDAVQQTPVGMIGLNGQAYLSAVDSKQILLAKWGDSKAEQCQFTLPELQARDFGYDEISLECHAVGEEQ